MLWLLLLIKVLSVNRGWTGMPSLPKKWNHPSCQSSKRRRTSATLTRSLLDSSRSSPSHEHHASSPPTNKKSLLTLTFLFYDDPSLLASLLPYQCDTEICQLLLQHLSRFAFKVNIKTLLHGLVTAKHYNIPHSCTFFICSWIWKVRCLSIIILWNIKL